MPDAFDTITKQSKIKTMQTENVEYLKKTLTYKGFGDEKLLDNLQSQIEKGAESFQLQHKENYERPDNKKNEFDVTLNFKRSKENDKYYFNSFDAVLTKAEGEKVKQSFYNAEDKSFTKKEAYNLMDGRAVKKEINHKGEKFNAYLQLNFEEQGKNGNYYFKSFHEKYGFDTTKVLNNLPIKELQNEKQKNELIKSLDKGNIQQITLSNNQKLFAAINPQFKSIQFSDANGRPLLVDVDAKTKDISINYIGGKTEKENAKETSKETIKEDAATEQKPQRSSRMKM